MTVAAQFRKIFVASQLERAAKITLQKWFPTYLRELERQLGLPVNSAPTPRNYTTRNKFDSLRGEEMPKVVVISPGLANAPLQGGHGQYRAMWRLGVGVAITAPSEDEAIMLSQMYGAAARAIVLQHQSLGDNIGIVEIHWLDETYDDLPVPDQLNQFRAAGNFFAVDVDNVVTKYAGPDTPDLLPADYDYGQVEDVIINLNKTPIT